MALTPLQVQDVCYGGGNWWTAGANTICKYLDTVNRKDGKYVQVCTKLNPGAYAVLDKRRQSHPNAYDPKGDNCSGYLLLQYKDQGYDKKP